MAQPTVVSRPATWAGTSGPILYKFTSTNYANAGYRMEVEIWDATAAAKIADAKYYANSSGAVTVDVSAFLKSNMSLDLEADLTSGTVYEDVNWIKYYIKYQEVWTASSESQVDDVANLRYAIYGGLQIGSSNDFTGISGTTAFLTKLDQQIPFNQNTIISVLTGADKSLMLQEFTTSALNATVIDLDDNEAHIVKINETTTNRKYTEVSVIGNAPATEVLTNTTFATNLNGWTASGFVWDSGGGAGTALGEDGDSLEQTFTTLPPGYYQIEIQGFVDPTGGGQYADIEVLAGNTIVIDGGTSELQIDWAFADRVANKFTKILFIPASFSNLDISVSDSSALTDVYIDTISFKKSSFVPVKKMVTFIEECQNTIVLSWRNSLGGWECYPFTYTQEYTWHYSDRKAKRLTLYANNLTLNQWEAIQGLNTLGELYKTPITELTTSLNRTMATIGQSVYVLNSDGTKTGVNVIGQPNTVQTKQKTYSATVTIEYPELFLQ